MKNLLLLVFASSCVYSFGQNYSIINPNTYNYYQFDTIPYSVWPQHDILTDKTDSVSFSGNDMILYPHHPVNYEFPTNPVYPCVPLQDTSWMGLQVIKKPDSTLFYNQFNETITIENPSQTGQNWTLFTYPNQDYLKATISSFDTLNSDSVAIISLQKYDSFNTLLNSSLNGETIVISKNNGMIRGFNWLRFPYRETDKPFLLTDHQKLTYGDVYDFNVGDEFHYRYAPSTIPPTHKIRTVKAKSPITNNSVEYVYEDITEAQSVDYSKNPPEIVYSTNFSRDTVTYNNLNQVINDEVPSVPLPSSNTPSYPLSEMYLKKNNYNGRSNEVVKSDFAFYNHDSLCYLEYFAYYEVEMIRGCGMTYTYLDQSIMHANAPEELIYFKKGNETFGQPHILTGINNNPDKLSNKLRLYPNPAKETVFIQVNSTLSFNRIIIYDISGRLIQETAFDSSIDVSFLKRGTYFIRLIGKNHSVTTRLIKD